MKLFSIYKNGHYLPEIESRYRLTSEVYEIRNDFIWGDIKLGAFRQSIQCIRCYLAYQVGDLCFLKRRLLNGSSEFVSRLLGKLKVNEFQLKVIIRSYKF
jgi:hypothetical protein